MLDAKALRHARGSFTTHANYLRAFATLAGYAVPLTNSASRAAIAARVCASPSYFNLVAGNPDRGQVRRSLANAWGAEMLLAVARKYAKEDALVRLSNNWGAAQLYYVFYHATQALFVASGNQRTEGHPRTQRVFEDRWVEHASDLTPWAFAATSGGYRNVPAGRAINHDIHPWTGCTADTCWDLAAKALRTTREDALGEAIHRRREEKRRALRKRWLDQEQQLIARGRRPRQEPGFALPRLSNEEHQRVEAAIRPFTLMDYLWRLRIKTNYEDATMFTDGPQEEFSSSIVHTDMVLLAESTLLVHELHIRQLIGAARMKELVDGWVRTNVPAAVRLGLGTRQDLITS